MTSVFLLQECMIATVLQCVAASYIYLITRNWPPHRWYFKNEQYS